MFLELCSPHVPSAAAAAGAAAAAAAATPPPLPPPPRLLLCILPFPFLSGVGALSMDLPTAAGDSTEAEWG